MPVEKLRVVAVAHKQNSSDGIDVCLNASVSQSCLHKLVQIYIKAKEKVLEQCIVSIKSLIKQALCELSV